MSLLATREGSQYTDSCHHQIKIDAGKCSNTILLIPFKCKWIIYAELDYFNRQNKHLCLHSFSYAIKCGIDAMKISMLSSQNQRYKPYCIRICFWWYMKYITIKQRSKMKNSSSQGVCLYLSLLNAFWRPLEFDLTVDSLWNMVCRFPW